MKKGHLSAAFLALGLLGACAPETSLDTRTPTYTADSQQDLHLRKLACDRPYTLLGDTNHTNPALVKSLASPAFYKTLEECKIKHLFLEFPAHMQGLIDDLTAGRKSKAAFTNDFVTGVENFRRQKSPWARIQGESFAELIVSAHQRGIAVHAARFDNGVNEVEAGAQFVRMGFEELSKVLPSEYQQIMVQTLNGTATEAQLTKLQHAVESNQTPEGKRGRDTLHKGLRLLEKGVKERVDDKDLHAFVISTSKGENAAIFYGNGHMQAAGGILALLGRDNVRWIAIKGSDAVPTLPGNTHTHKPDMIFDVRSRL